MFKNYFLATRPWSFPVSSMSVLVTAAYLFSRGYEIHWGLALWAVVGIILFHAAGNLISDYFDFKSGIDAEDTFGSKTLTSGAFTPKQVIIFGIVMLVLACLNGLCIMLVTGWQLLIFGGLGALFTLLYPWMKAHALGDFDILLEYGVIPALGTAFTIYGYQESTINYHLYLDALVAVPAFVTITIAVLHINNTRDTATDRRAHISTFAMLIGKENSVVLYIAELILPAIWMLSCTACGYMHWLVVFPAALCVKNAFSCGRVALKYMNDDQAINALDEATAKMQLMNGLSLTVFLVVAYWVTSL